MKLKTEVRHAVGAILCASIAVLVGGCSAGAEDGTLDESEVIDQLEESLSDNEVKCGEAAADATFTRVFSSTTTPSNYDAGKNGCGKAYFADVNDYRTSNGDKYNAASYGGAVPTTRTACEATRMKVYVFEKQSDGTADFVASATSRGFWDPGMPGGSGGFCYVPTVYFEGFQSGMAGAFNLTTGRNYKFAMAASDTRTDPHTLKAIRLYSGRKSRPI
jgi:hypothetical protein